MGTFDAVHVAVYDRLAAALAPLGCGVYDRPPPKGQLPVARLTSHDTDPDDTYIDRYTRHRLVIEIHTGDANAAGGTERSKRQARTLVEAARDALHRARLTLATGTAVQAIVERTNIDWSGDDTATESSLIVRVDVAE